MQRDRRALRVSINDWNKLRGMARINGDLPWRGVHTNQHGIPMTASPYRMSARSLLLKNFNL
jgi:hypothetical protein